jgi:hypothetical protein
MGNVMRPWAAVALVVLANTLFLLLALWVSACLGSRSSSGSGTRSPPVSHRQDWPGLTAAVA